MTFTIIPSMVSGGAGAITFHFHHPSFASSVSTSFDVTRPAPGDTGYFDASVFIRDHGSSAPALPIYKTIRVYNAATSCGGMACAIRDAATPRRPASDPRRAFTGRAP